MYGHNTLLSDTKTLYITVDLLTHRPIAVETYFARDDTLHYITLQIFLTWPK